MKRIMILFGILFGITAFVGINPQISPDGKHMVIYAIGYKFENNNITLNEETFSLTP